MVLRRFKTVTIFEMDSETGQSQIKQHYTMPLGEGSKLPKYKPKPATSSQPDEVEM